MYKYTYICIRILIYHFYAHVLGVCRFRVVVRSMAAFLSVQVQSETELRLQPSAELQLSAKAQQVGPSSSSASSPPVRH